MKKVYPIVFILYWLSGLAQPLQKVIYFPGLSYERHLDFNTAGQLAEVRRADGTIMEDFAYDANGNLAVWNIYDTFNGFDTGSHIFTYDDANRIASYNGAAVTYDASAGVYTYNVDYFGLIKTYTIGVTDDGFIRNEHWFMDLGGGEIDGASGVNYAQYTNGNVESLSYANANAIENCQHTHVPNPLKAQILPNIRAGVFTFFNTPSRKFASAEFASNWLESYMIYGTIGPESFDYYYFLDSNGKPAIKYRRYYYNNDFELEQVAAIYYYQGDIIP